MLKKDIELILNFFLGESDTLPSNLSNSDLLKVKEELIKELKELGNLQEDRNKLYSDIISRLIN